MPDGTDKFTWYKNQYVAGTPEADNLELKNWGAYKYDATSITTNQNDVNHAFIVKQENASTSVYSNEIVPAFEPPTPGPHIYFSVGRSVARLGVYLANYRDPLATNTEQSFYRRYNNGWVLVGSIPDTRSTGASYIELDQGTWATPATSNFEGWYTAHDNWRCDPGVEFKIAENSHMEHITNCASLFAELDVFNQDLSWWTCKPRVANRMFKGCLNFNQRVDHFDMSECIGIWRMFEDCWLFNQPVNSWDVRKVTNAKYAFNNCRKFNQSLEGLDWATCYELQGLMYNCTRFNSPIGNITILPDQTAEYMFFGCSDFNQPILGLNVTDARSVRDMFNGCRKFDQRLWNFNPANATSMRYTFADTPINQTVNHFNTSKVVDVHGCFQGCWRFSQDISNWNMLRVKDVGDFLKDCTTYYWDLSSMSWRTILHTSGWNSNTKFKNNPELWPTGIRPG